MPFDQPHLTYVWRGLYSVDNEPMYIGKHQMIVIPKGFQTDLASVPRIFWVILPPFGAYEAAAVLHDYLCTLLKQWHRWMQDKDSETPEVPPVSSRDADGLFRRVMRESKVGFCTRWAMWAGVRWGALFSAHRRSGWLSWPETPLVLAITAVELVVLVLGAIGIHLVVELTTGVFS